MKKKCYIAFLTVLLTVSTILTGCKGTERNAVSEEPAEVEETEEDLKPEEEKAKETDTKETDTKEDGEEESGKAVEKVEPVNVVRGEVRDGMFVNETFDIRFPLTEDMTLLEDSEILEVLGADVGFLEEGATAAAQEMEDAAGGTLYDAVIYLDDNSNVMLTYENMDVTMNGNYLDERRYVKHVKDALEQKSPGKYEIKSQKTVMVEDGQYLRVDLDVEMEGNELKEIFYCRRVENYMVCITVTFEEDKRQEAEAFIDSLNGSRESGTADSSHPISGAVEDGFYVNETFGIRFPITDNMSIMSAGDMEAVQGIGNEYLENEGIVSSEQMEKSSNGTLYDLAIYLEDGVFNSSVCYEDLDITNGGIVNPDEERYGKILRYTLSRLEGFDYEFLEDSSITLGGRDYYRMDFDVNAMGIDAHQIYIFRREENYMTSFIITYQDGMEQQIENFLNSITDV